MKNTFMVAAMVAMFGTAVVALDLNDSTFTTTVNSGNLEFSVDADENGLTNIETGVNVANGEMSYTFVSLGYDLDSDEIALGAEYNAAKVVGASTVVYGAVAVDYVTTETDLSNGDVVATPMVGATQSLSDSFAVYAEVDYAFVVNEDFDRVGGTVEVGVPYALTESVYVTPSLSRSFDTTNDATNFNLDVGFTF